MNDVHRGTFVHGMDYFCSRQESIIDINNFFLSHFCCIFCYCVIILHAHIMTCDDTMCLHARNSVRLFTSSMFSLETIQTINHKVLSSTAIRNKIWNLFQFILSKWRHRMEIHIFRHTFELEWYLKTIMKQIFLQQTLDWN